MSVSTIDQTGLNQSQILTAVQMPTGIVIQVLNPNYSTPVSNSTTTMATTGLSLSITPQFTTSKILLTYDLTALQVNNGGNGGDFAIYRNGSFLFNIGTIIGYISNGNVDIASYSVTYLDSPNTTSSTTYAIYFQSNANGQTITAQANSSPSFLTLQEIR